MYKWSIIPIKLDSKELCVRCDIEVRDMTSGIVHDTTLSHGQQLCELFFQIQHGSEELSTGYRFKACVHCDIGLGDMTFGRSHNHTLGSWTELCEILSRSDISVRCYGTATDLDMCALLPWPWKYDLGRSHDTPLDRRQQLCDISSRSNMGVRSYGPDKDFLVRVHCDIGLGDMTLVMVTKHPIVLSIIHV